VLAAFAAALLAAQAPADLDPATRPCQDFYQHANGGWLARTEPGAPARMEQARLGVLREIVSDAAQARAPEGSLQQRVGDFFASGMDLAAVDRAGLAPLKFALARIAALRSPRDLAMAVGRAHLEGAAPAFDFRVGPDDRQSTAVIAQFSQGGLGLADPAAYTGLEPEAQRWRGAYLAHVERMFALMGERPLLARAHAGIVLAMETRLARASMSAAERADPEAVYHRMSAADLRELAPGFDWATLFQTFGLKEEPVLVRQPRFFRELSAMARDTAPAQWQVYLRWQLLAAHAPYLGSALEAERLAFQGVTVPAPRWQRVLAATEQLLGEPLGRLYVDRQFSPRAKAGALELVANLRAGLRERLEQQDWLAAPARAEALRKLDLLTVKLGYPEHWREEPGPELTRASYAENVARVRAFEFRRGIARLGKPVPRAAWSLSPAATRIARNPALNEIVVPAALLQPPLFDPQGPAAANYGGIGVLIGRELIRCFDDQGRRYDALGNLRDWWSPADLDGYRARAGEMRRQLWPARPDPAEVLADLGGLKLARAGLRLAQAGPPRPADAGGPSPEQRFFLAYAQARRSLAQEPQGAAGLRVNAPLAGLAEFLKAFDCGEAQSLTAAAVPTLW
jgi:putative endopeptidase